MHCICVGSDISFDIHIRTPTPDTLEINGEEGKDNMIGEATNKGNNMKDLIVDQAKKAWGKLQRDTKFREEMDRQRYVRSYIQAITQKPSSETEKPTYRLECTLNLRATVM